MNKTSVCRGVLATLFCVGLIAVFAADEKLTNDSIVELNKMGLGEGVIVEKIKSSKCEFDTGMEGLKKLKTSGVSDSIIQAMIAASAPAKLVTGTAKTVSGDPNDPDSPHEAGIYVIDETDGKRKMTKLEPSVVSEVKTGSMMGVGWGGTAKTRAVLDGLQAQFQVGTLHPVFYFYFEETASGLSRGGSITSPNEFSLAEMEIRKSKTERRLVVGKVNLGGAKAGGDTKQLRAFDSEKVAPGVFKVTPRGNLAAGEYCFFYAGAVTAAGPWGAGAGAGGKLWDFGIK